MEQEPQKGSAANFLNCTKNTELTSGHFTRTFTFALTNQRQQVPAAKAFLRTVIHRNISRFLSGQRAMKSVEWKTYRTRFLVKAKQLSSSLSFTDHLGRQHCGRKGDYLVESNDGVLSIAPRQIFEDVYVQMCQAGDPSETNADQNDNTVQSDFRFEPLRIEKIKTAVRHDAQQRSLNQERERLPRVRKSPQSVRVTSSRLSLM
jgi:hypothetical protein